MQLTIGRVPNVYYLRQTSKFFSLKVTRAPFNASIQTNWSSFKLWARSYCNPKSYPWIFLHIFKIIEKRIFLVNFGSDTKNLKYP